MIDLVEQAEGVRRDALIRIIDFEATGLADDALVCEVGWTDLNAATCKIGATGSYLCRVAAMPPATRAVHHIRAVETQGFPPYDRRCLYEQAARDGVYAWAAHSAEFEAKFMLGSIPLFCTHKAALRHWPDAPAHGVTSLLYWLEDQGLVPPDYDPARAYPPHRAGPDSYATAVLLACMMRGGVSGRDLFQWTRQPRLLPRCPIGQYRDKPWAEVDWGFLDWILKKVDDPDIRFNAALEQERREERNER